jgi:hypothetical protein
MDLCQEDKTQDEELLEMSAIDFGFSPSATSLVLFC